MIPALAPVTEITEIGAEGRVIVGLSAARWGRQRNGVGIARYVQNLWNTFEIRVIPSSNVAHVDTSQDAA